MDSDASGVTAVIATRGRPELLRKAVQSILQQDTTRRIELIVVFDQTDIDALDDVEVPANRTLRTLVNDRTPGLAGSRNTGICAASNQLVAFCDDDDEWHSRKLTRQLEEWSAEPQAVGVSCGIEIFTADSVHKRLPPPRACFTNLLESRITELHPSTLLFRRQFLIDNGLVDEKLPGGYGEDYELLLRATVHGYLLSVMEPLTRVNWARTSYFAGRWTAIIEGLEYILEKYPQFRDSPKGLARMAGQIAFAYAALRDRDQARHWARVALARDRKQYRAYCAWLIVRGLLPPQLIVRLLNHLGRGL